MSETTLRSCPFCGGAAMIKRVDTTAAPWWLVRCCLCFAKTGEWRPEERAVEEWNRRVITMALGQTWGGEVTHVVLKHELRMLGEYGETLTVGLDGALRWHPAYGWTYGILPNTPAARQFLRRALARMEKAAKERK